MSIASGLPPFPERLGHPEIQPVGEGIRADSPQNLTQLLERDHRACLDLQGVLLRLCLSPVLEAVVVHPAWLETSVVSS